MPTLALVDGHSIAYRAFFALPEDLATTSGQVTNAVYGFTRMLIRLLADQHPEGIAVAWDVSRRTFRAAEYPEYKAQRTAAPDHFKAQLPLIHAVLDSLGIPQVQVEGFEADDVIASISRAAIDDGWDVVVVTGDRDAFQLVDDHLRVLYTRRGITDTVLADAAYVEERYGVPPARYVEYAALRGDTSDNLPGVPGVGEKTAAKLVAAHGTLEEIFEHVDELTPKLRENLADAREQVFLNRRLMTLVRDLDTGSEPELLHRGPWHPADARELFATLEFHSLWDDLVAVQPPAEAAGPAEVLEAEGRMATPELIARLASSPRLVLVMVDEGGFRGVAAADDVDTAVLIPSTDLGSLAETLANPAVAKVAHHAKPLLRRLRGDGLALEGLTFDTALAAYVIDPGSRGYGLAEVAAEFLGVELESADGRPPAAGQGMLDLSELDVDAVARRVTIVDRLEERLGAELEARDELELFRTVELPLVPVLARMEDVGIGVDRAYLIGLGTRLREEIAELESQIHELAGGPFNVNSTDQLREVLFERLGLPRSKKTSTGKPSTDAAVLEKLDHPLVDRLLRYRELEKLRSTYVDGYLPLIGGDGRIHTTYNQMAAATGRLSSEEPNLQNIPIRSDLGKLVRRAFVPRSGWSFIVSDYSQIELRILAHMSGDPGLVEAFRADEDIHAATAARVFAIDRSLVTPEMRRRAKMINFGLLYGMEAFGLAQRLDISRDEARQHMDAYFSQFPLVKEYMDGVVAEARRTGYTSTLFGRRRYLPELTSDNVRIRQMGERMALNAPVQGTAADVIKKAMIDLDAALVGQEAVVLLQIHDELVLEAPPEKVAETGKLVREVMEGVADLIVPLKVDVSTGTNLADAK